MPCLPASHGCVACQLLVLLVLLGYWCYWCYWCCWGCHLGGGHLLLQESSVLSCCNVKYCLDELGREKRDA